MVVGLVLYLNRLYRDARAQQTAERSGRRLAPLRWISAAVLGLFAIQLGAFAASNAFRSSPCSWLDLLRRLAGCQAALRAPDGVTQLSYASDGRVLATVDIQDQISLWSLPERRLLRTITHPDNSLSALALAPDSGIVAARSSNSALYLWRLSDGALLRSWKAHSRGIDHVAFSPDGTALASSGSFQDQTIRVWRVADGTQARRLPLMFADGLAFAPDSRTIVVGAYQDVYLWQYR